jgi:hypothetical protein
MKTIATIKNTALHSGKARTVVQRHDLAQYGFDCGQQIEIGFYSDHIGIRALEQGKRKISCVTDKRRNVVYQVIDIKWALEDRKAMFGNAEKLNVKAGNGLIVIEAAK